MYIVLMIVNTVLYTFAEKVDRKPSHQHTQTPHTQNYNCVEVMGIIQINYGDLFTKYMYI